MNAPEAIIWATIRATTAARDRIKPHLERWIDIGGRFARDTHEPRREGD